MIAQIALDLSDALAWALIGGTLGLVVLMVGSVAARKFLRDRREGRSHERRRRYRRALLEAHHGALAEIVAEVIGDRHAQADLAVVLDQLNESDDELDRDNLVAMQRIAWDGGLSQALSAQLGARRAVSRGHAALLLSQLRVPEAERGLPELLTDPDPDVRLVACAGLGRLGTAPATGALIVGLMDKALPDARIIERLGQTRTVSTMIAALESATDGEEQGAAPGWRAAVVRALGAASDPEAEPILASTLAGPDKQERIDAARALATSGTRRAVGPLIDALEDPDWEVRAQAAKSLGAHRDPAAAPHLERCLHHQSWWVRANAADALVAIGEVGIEVLRRTLDHEDRYARDRAREALALHGMAA